ncbi:Metallo-dependent phosphatase [Melanomma pulvis-pyrius CBS 109.77]|uniref:Metallo-dependent phosphatase n=1 Tax=Melanomma pulvis-pyrius CBS 109.77 TaxID=1314802 RepID=A0A6A6X0H5_9PLEO|nr:Metallo-dependent phosphatase [Melanomma pulvis-pyrius CBS 109.77]
MTSSTSALPSYVKSRFLILSDTHSALPSTSPSNNVAFRSPLPEADVVLHCGDLTMVGQLHEYEKALVMLSNIKAELKLVIAGNHDITLDEEYYDRKGMYMHRLKEKDERITRQAREMWTGEQARKAGVTYLDEGVHSFVLKSGAKLRVYASPYQPEFCDWAFPYFRNQDRYNPPHLATPGAVPIAQNAVPDFPAIDVMMTHGPPIGRRDETRRNEHVGCEHLLRAARRCRPRLHCFGHIHEGWGAERVRWKNFDDEDKDIGGKWEEWIESAEWIETDEKKMVEEGAVFLDLSRDGDGEKELVFGKETLMVNASIMSVRYKPWQGPWVVDLDLERDGKGEFAEPLSPCSTNP